MRRFIALSLLALALLTAGYHAKASDCTDACSSIAAQCVLMTGGDASCGSGYKDCMNYCSTLPDGMSK